MNYICDNIFSNGGHLTFCGHDVPALAEKYGTPLYLMDEERIRFNLNVYKSALEKYFNGRAKVLYAGKACAFRQIYRIMSEENVGIDVVSCGELYTALSAGYDASGAFFHSNNKTDADIDYAADKGIGYFVADNTEEIASIQRAAEKRGIIQKILIRITPGIDTHTYEAVNTGKVDSKFGSAIATGKAEEVLSFALEQKNISVEGLHCHVGSQIFEEDVFERAAAIMLGFIADMAEKLGFACNILDLGGGYGVRYVESDPHIDIESKIRSVSETVYAECARLGIPVPYICMEPGRSIVADAGMTVYTVGSVKKIPGLKNYVSVDGGMTDNPRFALYRSKYTACAASKADEEHVVPCSVVGRCCESGDIIGENVPLPESVTKGDILAVCTTGAYNYSMSSNYNRIPRPPVVMLTKDSEYLAVRRETFEDVARFDI